MIGQRTNQMGCERVHVPVFGCVGVRVLMFECSRVSFANELAMKLRLNTTTYVKHFHTFTPWFECVPVVDVRLR